MNKTTQLVSSLYFSHTKGSRSISKLYFHIMIQLGSDIYVCVCACVQACTYVSDCVRACVCVTGFADTSVCHPDIMYCRQWCTPGIWYKIMIIKQIRFLKSSLDRVFCRYYLPIFRHDNMSQAHQEQSPWRHAKRDVIRACAMITWLQSTLGYIWLEN